MSLIQTVKDGSQAFDAAIFLCSVYAARVFLEGPYNIIQRIRDSALFDVLILRVLDVFVYVGLNRYLWKMYQARAPAPAWQDGREELLYMTLSLFHFFYEAVMVIGALDTAWKRQDEILEEVLWLWGKNTNLTVTT